MSDIFDQWDEVTVVDENPLPPLPDVDAWRQLYQELHDYISWNERYTDDEETRDIKIPNGLKRTKLI